MLLGSTGCDVDCVSDKSQSLNDQGKPSSAIRCHRAYHDGARLSPIEVVTLENAFAHKRHDSPIDNGIGVGPIAQKQIASR